MYDHPFDQPHSEERAEEAAYWAAEAVRHEYAAWIELQELSLAHEAEADEGQED